MKQSFTTGEAARLCGLGLSTIKRWVRRDALKAYKTPGGDYRILREHLIDFMRTFNIPLHEFSSEDGPKPILIAITNPVNRKSILNSLERWGDALALTIVEDDLDLGYALGTTRPVYVIIEADSTEEMLKRTVHIRRTRAPAPIRIGAIVPKQSNIQKSAGKDAPEIIVTPENNPEWEGCFLENILSGLVPLADQKSRRSAG